MPLKHGLVGVLFLLCVTGCVYLPRVGLSAPSQVLPAPEDGRIARWLGQDALLQGRANLIADGREALKVRLDMIDAAQTSLDLQYFIWQNDISGLIVIDHLLAAADRGVRVRVLLDDVQLEGLVTKLTALDDHPNVEIRIFNPFSVRWRFRFGIFRLVEFLLDANRLNHRMHNKLLVTDNQVAILGGRNIGDDYFNLSRDRNFVDLDLLISGPAVPALSEGFNSYWISRWSYPVNRLLNVSILPDDLDRLRQRITQRLAKADYTYSAHAKAKIEETFTTLRHGARIERWQVVVDDPDIGWFNKPDELADELTDIALTAQKEILIVAPYLVPSRKLLNLAKELEEAGVRIEVITNSLQTNDVMVAQATYSNLRKRILATGVDLYEFRGDAQVKSTLQAGRLSLHPKYMLFDKVHVFLGSMNLDPRSLYLNTELGVYLRAPELADQLRLHFEQLKHPDNAWRVRLDGTETTWESSKGQLHKPPAKSQWQRLRHALYRLLPLARQV